MFPFCTGDVLLHNQSSKIQYMFYPRYQSLEYILCFAGDVAQSDRALQGAAQQADWPHREAHDQSWYKVIRPQSY